MLWLFCLLCVSALRSNAAVLRYDVQTLYTGDMTNLPADHWAQYNPDAFDKGAHSFVSKYDDAPSFQAIGIASPFFSHDSVSWHVSSNGFLAPTPAPLCQFFCTEMALDTLFGNYRFGDTVYGGGGDWPMIGLFVSDLSPNRAEVLWPVRLFLVPGGDNDDNSEPQRVIVEFRQVPVLHCEDENNKLTAQVEVWANGTIVMRYKTLPTCSRASVGLVLSKDERIVVSTNARHDGIAAIRYEPQMDTCPAIVGEEACMSRGAQCEWCAATQVCVAVTLAQNSCPRGSFSTKSPSSEAGLPALNNYYNVIIEQDVPLVSEASLNNKTQTYDENGQNELELGFKFPFYTKDQATHMTNRTYISTSGFLSVFSSYQGCGPIWKVCPNGNYSFAIMPFLTAQDMDSESVVTYTQLDERVTNGSLCENPPCPRGFFLEVCAIKAVKQPMRSYTYQVYMDESGVIEFRYGLPVLTEIATNNTALPFFAYPTPFIGLFRHRLEDPATIMVPVTLVRTGTRIRFEPKNICNDCGLGGSCDASSKQCVCATGFTGEACEQCAAGYFGPKCLPCRTCENNGTCDHGTNGTGRCQCPEPFSGESCSVRCNTSFDCSNCNLHGGYCECGMCVCDTASGWSGPHCDIPFDPCMPHSFGGCQVCNNDTVNKCAFCFDYTCYSTLLTGTVNEYPCSYTTAGEDTALCVPVRQKQRVAVDFGFISLFVLCLSAALSVIVIVVFTRIGMRARGVYDIHSSGASGGAPDYRAGRRERSVVQALFVQKETLKDRRTHVLGIPLKQMPLEKLYEAQRESQSKRK
ncbi:hypothetical protein DQ04_09241010 [Trypanosoma grayi]|uniref:hypothetical protein n=1 Tax=Trypanosoma grayi TaxID=71804 RepID=UPI0004F4084C|nr:hypothetical protein DQ04_09241010 [Trypanosoma grayi]KEG07626.1 hypothetical protein DQ04_09241010 [Trypanosoma grayi]